MIYPAKGEPLTVLVLPTYIIRERMFCVNVVATLHTVSSPISKPTSRLYSVVKVPIYMARNVRSLMIYIQRTYVRYRLL